MKQPSAHQLLRIVRVPYPDSDIQYLEDSIKKFDDSTKEAQSIAIKLKPIVLPYIIDNS